MVCACLFYISQLSHACSPPLVDPALKPEWYILQNYKHADLVFIGKVVKAGVAVIDEDEDNYEWQFSTFVIDQVLKGESRQHLSFKENITCCLCGIQVNKQQTYLVYARAAKQGFDLQKVVLGSTDIQQNLDLIGDIHSGKINPDSSQPVDFRKPLQLPANPSLQEIEQAVYGQSEATSENLQLIRIFN